MRKINKKITITIKNNFDLLKEANKRISELEETIVLNTCREITKPYCPMRIADLDMIEKNKKQIDVLKLNQTDGTPNQNFIAIHILKNGLTQIGLKSDNWFKKIEVVLRDIGKEFDIHLDKDHGYANGGRVRSRLAKLLEKLDSKTEKIDSETLKKIKNLAQEESDFYDKYGYYSFWSDKLKAQRIKNSKKLPAFICALKEQEQCDEEGSMDCLKGNSDGIRNNEGVCVHSKRELEYLPEPQCNHFGCKKAGIKEFNGVPYCEKHYNEKHPIKKATEPEKELYELYLKDGGQYYFKKITHPFTEYNNMVHLAIGKIVVNRSDKQELIEGVQDKLEFLRDKVLEAPILSGSVQDLRDHIHDLKDLVVKNIEEYEGMLK
jgi:hypothetical protein